MKMICPALLCLALGGLAPLVNAAGALEGQLQPAPGSLAELVVSRDENAANACEVGLYLQDELVAQISAGQAISLSVPAGEMTLNVAQSPSGYCAGNLTGRPQSVLIQPGERRHLRIVQNPTELFLSPAVE